MEHQPDDLVGEPLEEVPERDAGEYCNARRTRDGAFVGYCKRTSGWGTDSDAGRCSSHGGASGGAPEGNDWAATHGAYSKSFVEDFLRDEEIERVRQFEELTETLEGAQAIGRTAAAIAMEQFRRTGDERFLRRAESICDTFGIAPADELELSGSVDGERTVSFDAETAAAIREATLDE